MFNRTALAFVILVLWGAVSPAPAQSQWTVPPPPGAFADLADVLPTARKPQKGIVLAVSRGLTTLQPGASVPAPGSRPEEIARAFGLMTKQVGAVLVIAPPAMSVLNPHPTAPDPYQDLEPKDALKLLIATLNPAQWQALTGDRGLGIADLEEKQQGLFKALFPGGALRVQPQPDPGPREEPSRLRTLSGDELLQGRLRLTQAVDIHGSGLPNYPGPTLPGAPRGYSCDLRNDAPQMETRVAGVVLQTEVPNVPKPGDLDYHAPRFVAPIPLEGLKTVGDLIARIGRLTGTELYADAHLEAMKLAILGADRAVPAADLLPAIAFCATATYRRVGPAFVLTDDLVGVGTRRLILEQFIDAVDSLRSAMLTPAEAALRGRPLADLPLRSDSVGITPDQIKNHTIKVQWMGQKTGATVALSFEEMNPDQQQAVRNLVQAGQAEAKKMESSDFFRAQPEFIPHPTMDGTFVFSTRPSLLFVAPALDAPVDLDQLASPSGLGIQAIHTGFDGPRPALPPLPRPEELLKRYGRRAILAQPRTLSEVDALIAAMPGANLNELWLVVPRPGEPQNPSKDSAPRPSATELVDRTLAQTRNTGIRVLPTLDLFYWGMAAPADAVDYTILGETSAQVEFRQEEERQRQERERQRRAGKPPGIQPAIRIRRMAVSPFVPAVEATLSALEKAVIRPGIAGLVWLDPTVPGYDEPDGPPLGGQARRYPGISDRNADATLGYVVAGRLGFLRQNHVDPVDINPGLFGSGMAPPPLFNEQTQVPLGEFYDEEIDRVMRAKWRKFRAGADVSLLRRLFETGQTAAGAAGSSSLPPLPASQAPRLPILVGGISQRPWFETWFGSWDDPRIDPPGISSGTPPSGVGLAGSAHIRPQVVIARPTPGNMKSPAELARYLEQNLESKDGVVFDLSTQGMESGVPQTSMDLLIGLTRILHTVPQAGE